MKQPSKKLNLSKFTVLKLEQAKNSNAVQGGKKTDLCPTRISLAPTCNLSQGPELCCG
ncbi:MAG: hypothetical protein JNM68_12770 [Dinghuibacter sp.]|nr:hypothetical protein [Dinghuibacter sp.]